LKQILQVAYLQHNIFFIEAEVSIVEFSSRFVAKSTMLDDDMYDIMESDFKLPYPEAVITAGFCKVEPPHFMNQTFAGAQPARSGNYNEGERVRNSFRTGSFWSLKKLPAKIEPGEITKQRKVQTSQNLSARPDRVNLASQSGPLSSRAEKYVGTQFDKPDMLRKLRVDEEKYQCDMFSRKVFTVPAQMKTHRGANFVSPEFGPGAAVADDCLARKPGESTFLHGPFYQNVPAVAKEIPRTQAKGWVKSLYEQLAEDWAELIFSIKLTPQEIVVKFPTQSQRLPPESALSKYMARQASHGNPQKWGLRKRGDRWCKMEVPNASLDNSTISTVLAEQTIAGEPFLTFAFYLPWETVGLQKVTKQTGLAARDRVRNRRDQIAGREAAFETSFKQEQEAATGAETQTRARTGRSSMAPTAANVQINAFLQQRARADSQMSNVG